MEQIFFILSKYSIKHSTYILKYLFPSILSGDYTERVEKLFTKLSKIFFFFKKINFLKTNIRKLKNKINSNKLKKYFR